MTTIAPPSPREITTEPRTSDKVFRGLVTAGGLSSLLILGLIAIFLGYRGFEVLVQEGFGFITNSDWSVTVDENANVVDSSFGLAAMLVGTILCAFVAVVIALPISVFSALFLNFYAPDRLKRFLVALIDMMAAFPSILFGIWGFLVLMPSVEYWAKLIHRYLGFIPIFDMQVPVFTRSPFVAGVVLAIMIIPIITSVTREVMSRVDKELISAAFALGGTSFSSLRRVVIPTAKSGILGGILLGLGRALGETVAIYYVLNLLFETNFYSILEPRGGSIASLIISRFGEATQIELNALMAAGVVLFIFTLIVNMFATAIVQRAEKRMAS